MRFYNYALIGIGLAIIFELAGMSIAGSFLDYIGVDVTSGFNITGSGFWIIVIATIGGASAVGIASGLLGRSISENYILVPVIIGISTSLIVPLIGLELYARTNFLGTWIHIVTMFISAILIMGYIVSLVDFFRGTD
jgi:hypothetical protein